MTHLLVLLVANSICSGAHINGYTRSVALRNFGYPECVGIKNERVY